MRTTLHSKRGAFEQETAESSTAQAIKGNLMPADRQIHRRTDSQTERQTDRQKRQQQTARQTEQPLLEKRGPLPTKNGLNTLLPINIFFFFSLVQ